MTFHTIAIGDSRNLHLDDSLVHLIVTSPPYFDARDYGIEEQIGHGSSLNEYLAEIGKVFKECHRVLQPGRKFCLNISDLPIKGKNGVKWIPLGFNLLSICLDIGFELSDRIIWQKIPMKGFQWGSLPYPPSPLICDSMEYIFVLKKKGKPDYSYVSKKKKEKSKLRKEEFTEYTKQIWSIKRVRLKDNINGHIAPFPIELPKRCIKLYSFIDDIILDPFGGSGTTTAAAIQTNRNSILYEVNSEYLELIKEKVGYYQHRLDQDVKFSIVNHLTNSIDTCEEENVHSVACKK